jgi:penicillin-binding protein 1A
MSKSRPPKKSGRGRPSAITSTKPSRPGARKSDPPRSPLRKWALTLLALLLFLGTLSAVIIAGTLWYYSRDLPSAEALRHYEPPQTTRVLDRRGRLIAEVFNERRTVVPMDKVPRVLVLSVLAAEDADFYHHAGMDLPSLLRVMIKAVLRGRATQGGSTITQQVVKNLLLSPERTLERKIKELILARRIEQDLKKDEILWLYLNHINFGHGRYGVEEAARYYFGKHVEQLTLSEASLIAGIPQSPTYLSPRSHPEAARRRQLFVLGQLEQKRDLYWDDLPLSEIEKAKREPAKLSAIEEPSSQAPELAQLGKQALLEAVGPELSARGGYTITTTLDLDLQTATRAALQKGLNELDARHARVAPFTTPKASDKELRKLLDSTRVDAGTRGELLAGRTYDAVVLRANSATELELSLNGALARASLNDFARYNPKHLPADQVALPGTAVRVTLLAKPEGKPLAVRVVPGPEGAAILVDPRTRDVLALVGGYDATNGFNRATQALRQPGSTFKAIVYSLAIKSRKYTPATLVIDAPGAYDQYKPANYETWTYEGPVRLRHGLAQSINSVAVRVIDDLGAPAVVDMARAFGITAPLDPVLPLALGASDVQLFELTNAYATLAAGGRFQPLRFVKRVTDMHGREVKLPESQAARDVLTPAEAFIVTSLLESVVQEGTATKAKALGRPAAGKTGTSNQARDAWFVGYTTELAGGVWVGFDDRRSLGNKESGGKAALPVWIEMMKTAHAGKPVRGFDVPSGVVTAKIDPATGLLAYEGEEHTIEEVFLEDTVPTQIARPPDVADPTTFLMEQLGSSAPPP